MRKTSGVSLMLLIFLSLCLIIFSLLSLSGAVADETLSSQAAERTTEYYAAVTTANNMLARIDEQLAAYLREAEASQNVPAKNSSGDTKTAYLQLCDRIDEDISDITWKDREEGGTDSGEISFSVDVDDEQILQIQLDVSYPDSDSDTLYRIRTWKIVNTADWNADNSMRLFRSENLSPAD